MDTLKDILAEKLKAPLFWYTVISWASYNWPNIAILFMSKYPVLSRIDIIKKTPHPYLKEIVLPVITGIVLTILIPYISLLLTYTQTLLKYITRRIEQKDIAYSHGIEMDSLSRKAEIDTKYQLEKANRDLDILRVNNTKKEEELNIQETINNKESLEEEITKLKDELKSIELCSNRLKNRVIYSLSLIDDMMEISDPKDTNELKLLFNKEFSSEEIQAAKIAARIRKDGSTDNLTTDEINKFLNLVQEQLESEKN